MKNEQIAQAFFYGQTARTENLFIEDKNGIKIIYSYGRHFPIAIKFSDGYLFNSDGYSNTTARHKNLVLSYIKSELADEDFLNTIKLKSVVDKIKYGDIKTKAEFIEQKI